MYDFTDETFLRYPNQMDKHLLLDKISVILCEILRELWVTILTQRGTEKAQRNTAFSNLLLFCFQRIFSFVKKLVLQFTNCFIGFYLLNHFHQLRNCFVNQQFPGLCVGFGAIAAVMVRVTGVPQTPEPAMARCLPL